MTGKANKRWRTSRENMKHFQKNGAFFFFLNLEKQNNEVLNSQIHK